MNCISLWQPWASAIAVGLKTLETRSWAAPKRALGQPLAIAAAKTDNKELRAWWMKHVRGNPEYMEAFALAGIGDWDALPKGQVVCTTSLYSCPRTDTLRPDKRNADWGDFSPGRFAWYLIRVERLKEPVPVVGRQGIFNWSPPVATGGTGAGGKE